MWQSMALAWHHDSLTGIVLCRLLPRPVAIPSEPRPPKGSHAHRGTDTDLPSERILYTFPEPGRQEHYAQQQQQASNLLAEWRSRCGRCLCSPPRSSWRPRRRRRRPCLLRVPLLQRRRGRRTAAAAATPASSRSGTRSSTRAISSTTPPRRAPWRGRPTARPSSTAPPAAGPTAASSSTSSWSGWGSRTGRRTWPARPRRTSGTAPTSPWRAAPLSTSCSSRRSASTSAAPRHTPSACRSAGSRKCSPCLAPRNTSGGRSWRARCSWSGRSAPTTTTTPSSAGVGDAAGAPRHPLHRDGAGGPHPARRQDAVRAGHLPAGLPPALPLPLPQQQRRRPRPGHRLPPLAQRPHRPPQQPPQGQARRAPPRPPGSFLLKFFGGQKGRK